jgi:iron complex outermembrane recepter protein
VQQSNVQVLAWVVSGAIASATTLSVAQAQTQLPTITVTTPSPVAPAPQPAAPVAAPVAAAPAPAQPKASPPPAKKAASAPQLPSQPAPVTAPPPAPPVVVAPLPGTLLVADQTFAPVTVITAREIESKQGATLTDTLQTKPGVTGSTFAAGSNRPVIRGLDNYRVRVQENGVGAHDVSNLSEDHAVPVDPNAAQQVEIIRGPATLRYGSQAIGGVVSASNDRIPEFLPRNGWTGSIRGGLTSVDRGRDGAFSITGGASNIVVHADAFNRSSGDYNTPQGRQANTFVDSDGFAVGSSLVGTAGFVGVSFSRFNSLYGIPGEEAALARKRIDMTQDKINSKGELRVRDYGIEAIRYWFGTTTYAHNELVDDGEVGSRFTNKEREGRFEVQHMAFTTPLGEVRGAAGIQFGLRNISGISNEGDNLLDPARTRSIAAFLFEELQLTTKLRLQAAARIEQTAVSGVGLTEFADPMAPVLFEGERKFKPASASLGALYQLPLGVVARLTGQYVERAPDAGELFSKGAHEATETFEIGNPLLNKEKARTIEFGLKRAKGDLRFDASAFYTKYDGFIFKRLTGVECGATLDSCGADPELKQLVFEQRKATFYGFELGAQYDVAKVWRGVWGVEGQYDFVNARFDGDGNVPRIPPHRVGAGVYYRDANWFARVNMLHAFDQNRITDSETATKGYTLLSAELSYTFKLASTASVAPEMTIGLKGENLLDDDVRNHVSFKKDEVLQPGRGVRLFGVVKF